jgi:hypothetical protein
MYDLETHTRAVIMCRSGVPNADVARQLAIPVGTIGTWKFKDRARHPELCPITKRAIPCCHWTCLFPQHGPGMKHTRKIELADWQREIVEVFTHEFIRGLIHSDGCRCTNWTEKIISGELKRYEYIRYTFSNVSTDIHGLYQWALDILGIEWTQPSRKHTSVAKRASVALMDTFVGPKF